MEQWYNARKSLMSIVTIVKQWTCSRNVKATVSTLRDKSLRQRDDHNKALFDRGSCQWIKWPDNFSVDGGQSLRRCHCRIYETKPMPFVYGSQSRPRKRISWNAENSEWQQGCFVPIFLQRKFHLIHLFLEEYLGTSSSLLLEPDLVTMY